jgi:hypothetical protein
MNNPAMMDERERLLIEAVVALARTLRDERDHLVQRLRQVEYDLTTLAQRLEPRRSRSDVAVSHPSDAAVSDPSDVAVSHS